MPKVVDIWATQAILELELHKVFREFSENEWKEDWITFAVLRATRNVLNRSQLPGVSHPHGPVAEVSAKLFKQSGTPETKTGDVAIVVEISLPGSSITGVGYLEAKKREWDKSNFPAVAKPAKKSDGVSVKKKGGKASLGNSATPASPDKAEEQFDNILKNAPHALLMLYDQNPGEGRMWQAHCESTLARYLPHYWHFLSELISRECPSDDERKILRSIFRTGHVTSSNVLVLSLGIANSMPATADAYYRTAFPFSHQICQRYLLGQDISSDPTLLSWAGGFQDEVPGFLLKLSVRFDGNGADGDVPDSFMVNMNSLEKVLD